MRHLPLAACLLRLPVSRISIHLDTERLYPPDYPPPSSPQRHHAAPYWGLHRERSNSCPLAYQLSSHRELDQALLSARSHLGTERSFLQVYRRPLELRRDHRVRL